jgi:hypothetical protein
MGRVDESMIPVAQALLGLAFDAAAQRHELSDEEMRALFQEQAAFYPEFAQQHGIWQTYLKQQPDELQQQVKAQWEFIQAEVARQQERPAGDTVHQRTPTTGRKRK